MANTINIASDSTLLELVEKIDEQNSILRGSTTTIQGNSVFIRYSANADGSNFTESWSEGQDYIGVAVGQEAPADKENYEWILFKGANGTQIIINPQGTAMTSLYRIGIGDTNYTIEDATAIHQPTENGEGFIYHNSALSLTQFIQIGDGLKVEDSKIKLSDNDFATETYVDNKIAAIPTPDVPGQIDTHNTNTSAHNDIRLLVDDLTTRLNALANSDDTTLDQMSEVVAYIKNNKSLIEGITTDKINVSDIIDNLITNVSNKPLSAAQGVALKSLIDEIVVPTKVSQLANDKNYLTSYTETDPTVPSWAKASTKPAYTASEVGADASGTASSAVSTHNSSTTAHADIRNSIESLESALDNKADKSRGIFYIEGDASSATDTTNKVATWIGSHDEIASYFSGLTILYKIVTAGSTTTTLNINGLGAVPVVRNATTAISTAYPVNGVLMLTYTVDSDGTAYWKTADYDVNTKNTAGASNKTGSTMYLVGSTSQPSSSSSGTTTYTNKNCYIGTNNRLYSGGELVKNTAEIEALIDEKLGVIENGAY